MLSICIPDLHTGHSKEISLPYFLELCRGLNHIANLVSPHQSILEMPVPVECIAPRRGGPREGDLGSLLVAASRLRDDLG